MTLTTNGKNYIATTFGNASKCYTASGLNWSYLGTDSQTYNESGGTAQIVSRLIMTSLVQSVTYNSVTYTYSMLRTANDNTDLILSDAQWIAQNDGTPTGEAQYCAPLTTNLTANGKNWIGDKFGNASRCYVASGLNWSYLGTDSQTYNESGGTAQIVSRLIMTSLVQSVTYNGVTYTYSMLRTANDNINVILSDAQWIAQNDGTPAGEPQYCSTAPLTGSISCTTSPAGASVALDGVNQGAVTPVTLQGVSPGSHTVTFTLSGYNSCPVTVNVVAGQTTNASCTMTPIVTTGSISCTTIPAGASVTLDGVSQGVTTPVTLSGVSSGSHTVTFNLSGYNVCQVPVTVTAGQTASATCTLTPVVTTGSISCTTIPSGASIALDGVNQGVVTPVTLSGVSAGSHSVTFTLTGYNACQVSVTVAAGQTASASCTLTAGCSAFVSNISIA